MEISKFNYYLKWAVAVLLIVLALMSVYYKFDNCSRCKFNYDGEKYDSMRFTKLYSSKCLVEEKKQALTNLSVLFND